MTRRPRTDDLLARRLNVARLKSDDRELQAQIVNCLNDAGAAIDAARVALLNDDRAELVALGRRLSDRGVSLMMLAQD